MKENKMQIKKDSKRKKKNVHFPWVLANGNVSKIS